MRQRSKHLSSKNKTLVKTEKFLRNAADCEQRVKGLRMSEIPDGRRETSQKNECEADGNEVKSAAVMSVKKFQKSKTGAV